MPEELLDWADPRFLGHLLAHHPAPTYSPVTGEKLWDGIRLHGAQRPILDAIKALNYLLYWWFQPGRQRHRGVGIYSAPLELTFG